MVFVGTGVLASVDQLEMFFASTFASKLIKPQMNLPPSLPLNSCSARCFLLFKDVFGYWQVIVSLLAGLRSKTGLGTPAFHEGF